MGCGCGGGSAQQAGANGYIHTSADGKTQTTLRTEIEAKAKKIREGGSYAPR